MRKTNTSIWVVTAIALAMIASACSGGSSSSDSSSGGSDSGGGDASGDISGNVRVWTHQNNAFNDGLKELATAFEAENPGVTIEFETFDYDSYQPSLQTAIPAGTEGDILQVFGSWACSYSDNLATVPEDVLTKAKAEEIFFGAAIDGYTCGDSLYGMPQEYNIEYGAALINETMAAEAGIDPAVGWADWDAFIADAAKMSIGGQGDMTRSGYMFTASDALAYTFYSMIVQQGGSYLADDGSAFTIDTPEGKAALEQMMAFVEADLVDPVLYNDESNWVGDCFFQEFCATGLVGPWVVADYAGDFPEVAEVTSYVALPSMGAEPNFVADSGWGLTVSSGSDVQAAAWAFVEYVTLNEANAIQWNAGAGTLPALKSNATGANADGLIAEFPHFAAFLPLLEHGQYVGDLPDRDLLFYDITYPHVLQVLQGNESIADGLANMEREANEAIG